MKLSSAFGLVSATLTLAPSFGDGFAPIGRLNIDSSLVREGANPFLSWQISFPVTSVDKVVEIEPDNAVKTKGPVNMTVRVLGASYQPYGDPAAVNLQVKLGYTADWETAFHGTNRQVDPSETVFSAEVPSGTVVDFAGAGNLSRDRWTSSRNTLSKTRNVIALKDGDPVPSHLPAFRQGRIKDHVSPYVEDGKIALGPNELIYLIELGQTDPSKAGFDMQDLVAVARFDPIVVTEEDEDTDKDEKPEVESSSNRQPGAQPYQGSAKPAVRANSNRKRLRSR